MALAQTADFSSILDAAPSEVERPKPLPQGTYTAVVQGLPRQDKSTKKQTPYVEFTLAILANGVDVDQDELKAMGGFSGKTMRATFYLTEGAAWRLDEFLEHLGIELDGKKSRAEMIEEAPGKQVGVYVKHTPSQDGQSIYAEISRTLPLE